MRCLLERKNLQMNRSVSIYSQCIRSDSGGWSHIGLELRYACMAGYCVGALAGLPLVSSAGVSDWRHLFPYRR